MDKIKLQLKKEGPSEIFYKGQTILVRPYVSMLEKHVLYESYISSYFKDGDIYKNHIDGEYIIILTILDLLTNIEIEDLDIDEVVSSELWKEICSKIKNYEDIRKDLESITRVVLTINAAEKSRGILFDQLIQEVMKFIGGIDLSEDSLNNIMSKLKDSLSQLNEKFIDKNKEV